MMNKILVFIVVALLQLQVSLAVCNKAGRADYSNSSPVELLQAYIQINTTTYNDLSDAVEFWRKLAALADVPINVYEIVEGFPIVVLKWAGTDSSQHSIMLNSHMDVVPAALEDGWTYDPFSGHIDEINFIYGRGTQDMKSVSIQYYTALRRLKENNVTLLRDVYMTLMPDEEVGAEAGMIPFLQSKEFAEMNVGIELDEGSSFPLPVIAVFYQDKVVWQIKVDCHGVSAHGSTFPATNDTATGKCRNVMNKFFEFRDEQYELAKVAPPNDAGGYTSININKINGGTANNVIPSLISLTIDIRLGTTVNEVQMDAKIRQIIAESGSNITFSYILKNPQSPATIVNASNPYWNAVNKAADELGVGLLATIPPGSTDARHVRNAGYPALGLSPMPNTELLLHSVNERLGVTTFLNGIDLYEKIIYYLATIPAEDTAEDGTEYLKVTAR